jgi:peptide/nickel transport system ATP-binding protein
MRDLHVAGLTVRYGDFVAVDNVSFDVPGGSVLGLAGQSGSGKSTVARAVAGLTRSRGTVLLGGTDLRRAQRRGGAKGRRMVQMIFQDPTSSLDPRFTVRESIVEALPGQSRSDRRKRNERVAELLSVVALHPAISGLHPRMLSGGQRQRVAIARALAAEPEVLIADEVTASLDVSVQAVVLNLLKQIQRDMNLTMLFITHNLAVVRYICDDLAILNHGKVVEHGPAGQVLDRPHDPYTTALVGAVLRPGSRLAKTGSAPSGDAPRPDLPSAARGARTQAGGAVTAGGAAPADRAAAPGSGERGTGGHLQR